MERLSKGLCPHVKKGKVPHGGKGIVKYLAKYVDAQLRNVPEHRIAYGHF